MSAGVAQLFDAPGPRGRTIQRVAAAVLVVVALALGAAVLWKLGERGNLAADKWRPFATAELWQFYIIPGLINTLYAAAISIVLAGALGLLLALGRLSTIAPLRWAASVFVEFFRAVPVLVMMLLSFWGYLEFLPIPSSYLPLAGVVTGLTLYNACVLAELLRSGVHSLPKGQAEAGLSIGLTRGQTLMAIQLPQALRAMLPALVGQLVVILKDTALGYQILYAELLRQAERIGSAYFNIVPALIVIAVIYIAINFALTSFATWLERRLSRRGRFAGRIQTPDPVAGVDAGVGLGSGRTIKDPARSA